VQHVSKHTAGFGERRGGEWQSGKKENRVGKNGRWEYSADSDGGGGNAASKVGKRRRRTSVKMMGSILDKERG
jgi:hypothetical protein